MNTKYQGMMLKVAWRNVWRNKVRSLIVVLAVGLGLWAGIFTASFMYGVSQQRLKNIVNAQLSHIQMHHPAFTDDMDPAYRIAGGENILRVLRKDARVKSTCGRAIATGMVASPRGSGGVLIRGISPQEEAQVTNIHEKLQQGSYFDSTSRKNQILIGQNLADKLQVGLKKKVNLTIQNLSGDFVSESYVIAGIFKTNSAKYDEGNVFVRRDTLANMLGDAQAMHEIAVLLRDADAVDLCEAEFKRAHPELAVESWKELAPELNYINQIMDEYLRIFMSIILLAMAFGIINTMLMAVMERTREIGVLMAIGMNKARVFFMILLETVFLTLTGVPVGLLLSFLTIRYFSRTGVDLSLFSKGLANFDVETVVYPSLDTSFYPMLILMAAITALLSAVYPAYKALKLNPSTAIRAI